MWGRAGAGPLSIPLLFIETCCCPVPPSPAPHTRVIKGGKWCQEALPFPVPALETCLLTSRFQGLAKVCSIVSFLIRRKPGEQGEVASFSPRSPEARLPNRNTD